MNGKNNFDLRRFLPYVANQAAEAMSLEFQQTYKGRYGMLRTEWRVLFHLGRYGDLTAGQICGMAKIHKTKTSRAVAALEKKRFLTRLEYPDDRRHALLTLTRSGWRAFNDLCEEAKLFDAKLRSTMTPEESRILERCLLRIAGLDTAS